VRLVEGGSHTIERLGGMLGDLGAATVGFEADSVTVSLLERFERAGERVEWRPTQAIVEAARVVKDDHEIECIKRAVKVADRAMEHAFATARPGMSEMELAWSIERFMRENGAEAVAFDTIVAAGENSARPHHHPSGRAIKAGEAIVIDLGARVDGYHSDVTRTICLGEPIDPEYERVWSLVEAANRAATLALGVGQLGAAIDRIARDHLAAAGFGDDFKHSLGHGVGLDIHEAPRLSQVAPEIPLPAGAVVTIEPGVYLEGRFGVRIEDTVVVRAHGAEVLTQVGKRSAVGHESIGS
jgi:Xaa-Pro aminopeptidase